MRNFSEQYWGNWLYYIEEHSEEITKAMGVTFYRALVHNAEEHIVNCIYEVTNKQTNCIIAECEDLWLAQDIADMHATINKDFVVKNKHTGAIEYDTSK